MYLINQYYSVTLNTYYTKTINMTAKIKKKIPFLLLVSKTRDLNPPSVVAWSTSSSVKTCWSSLFMLLTLVCRWWRFFSKLSTFKYMLLHPLSCVLLGKCSAIYWPPTGITTIKIKITHHRNLRNWDIIVVASFWKQWERWTCYFNLYYPKARDKYIICIYSINRNNIMKFHWNLHNLEKNSWLTVIQSYSGRRSQNIKRSTKLWREIEAEIEGHPLQMAQRLWERFLLNEFNK